MKKVIKRMMNRSALNCCHAASSDHRFRSLLRAGMLILWAGLALSPAWAQKIRLKSGEFDPLTGPLPVRGLPSERLAKAAPSAPQLKAGEMRLAIVQWGGGLNNDKIKAFKALGGQMILPMPTAAAMALVPAGLDLKTLPQNPKFARDAAPRWAGALAPEWKLDPRVRVGVTAAFKSNTASTTVSRYLVQFAYTTGNSKDTRAIVQSLGRSAKMHSQWKQFENWFMMLTPADVERLARLNSVFWIEPAPSAKMLSERTGLAVANITNSDGSGLRSGSAGSYGAWLNKVGLHGDNVTVQIMDDGLSQGNGSNVPGTAHPDILGRIAGIDNPTIDPFGNSVGGHGHLNASIIMGQPIAGGGLKDPGGYLLGQGVAPHARIYSTKFFDNSGNDFRDTVTSPRSIDSLMESAYIGGARISSNSWGIVSAGAYTADSQLFDRLTRDASGIDGYQPMIFTFAAGNQGATSATPDSDGLITGAGGSLESPATAKNVISVGATENSDRGEIDGIGIAADGADDLRDMALFSSRGPTADGRFGPTLVAPGTHIAGAASDSINPPFDGSTISGRLLVQANEDPSAAKYYPAHQAYYTWGSGTSHACPAVSGALALLYEYCMKEYKQPPSPALARAMLISSAVDIAGGNRSIVAQSSAEKLTPIPNNDAGWGRCSLSGLVDHTRTQFKVDQTDILNVQGQVREYKIPVSDATQPLKIVLAWTDPPAATGALTTLVNDLDLEVSNGINTWLGNIFVNGESSTGGAADTLNNTECVFIKKPVPGIYTIRIKLTTLGGDALPDTGNDLEQDYALFVSNGIAQSSQAQISLDKTVYRSNNPVTVALSDADLKNKGYVDISLASLAMGDSETLRLTEMPAGSGFYRGTMSTVTGGRVTAGNKLLTVCNKETVRATYIDNGGVARTAQGVFDVQGPVLVSQSLSEISYDWARFKLVTNEPTSVTLSYTQYPSSRLLMSVSSQQMSTVHDLRLSPLMEGTPYFYMIKLVDKAGNTSVYNNPSPYDGKALYYTFQTKVKKIDYLDQFEKESSGWKTSVSTNGMKDWYWGAPYQDQYNNHAWFTYDTNQVRDVQLISPSLKIKPNSELSFWQWYKFQPIGKPFAFDGGVVEISTDGGTSWKDLGPYFKPIDSFKLPFIVTIEGVLYTLELRNWIGKYDAVLSTGSYNPLGGRQAWSGRSWDRLADPINLGVYPQPLPRNSVTETSASTPNYQYMYPVNIDLSSFSGETAQFRFRNSSDNSVKGDRWIIDDFSLTSPADGVTSLTRLAFDTPAFNASQTRLRFTVTDSDLSSSTGAWPVNFSLSSSSSPDSMPVTPYNLKMIDPRGVWEGYLSLTSTGTEGVVRVNNLITVAQNESLTLSYNDPDVGDGTPYTVLDSTRLDSLAPKLLTNEVSQVRNHDFLITLTANEPVTATIQLYDSKMKLVRIFKQQKLSTAMDIQITNVLADTSYYYTIWLSDEAGNRVYDDNSGFAYGVRTKSYVWDKDTLEPSPVFKWTHGATVGQDVWQVVANQVYHTATHAWFGHSSPERTDSSLVFPVPEIKEGYKLRFWHSVLLDAALDGAVIEISKNNGASWEDLGPYIISGIPYNYIISSSFGSQIGGRYAWSGAVNSIMGEVTVDLSPFNGANRLIRFRLVCDQNSRTKTGWYIDDVTIDKYGPSTGAFPNKPVLGAPTNGASGVSYAQNLTLKWNATTGAAKYQVFIGSSPADVKTKLVDTVYTNADVVEQSLKPGTTYFWRVLAINGTGQVPSDVRSFKTQIINPAAMANHLLEKTPGLTSLEKTKGDYNGDGVIDITDLIENNRRR